MNTKKNNDTKSEQLKIVYLNTESKKNLLALLQEKGEFIPAYCGGNGTCGKCRVLFQSTPPVPVAAERKLLSEEELAAGWRLACETDVCGSAVIGIPDYAGEETMEAESGFYQGGEKIILTSQEEICHGEGKRTEEKGNRKEADSEMVVAAQRYVVAIDIGTTTLAASLVDTESKTVVKTVTGVNHQRIFGADVISRMEASNQGKGEQLKQYIRQDIEKLLQRLGVSMEIPLIIAGNTTMEHLLLGYSCETLGVAPYTPVDISLHQADNMTILPGISTFVGADIVCGMLALGMDRSDEVNLLVDLGTNGEMVLGNRQKMLATSTAAGPAFEGGNISCGVAGIEGAITSVEMRDGTPVVRTIGDKPPVGLCGTGVLECVYELLKEEIVDETGALEEEWAEDGYPLAPAVTFTGKDVREVQLAKAAIRAGIEMMLEEYGVSYMDITHVYLAGGFGQKVNIKKAVGIGLLPEELSTKVTAVGNSSLAGAILYAENPSLAERISAAAKNTEEISLAENPLFSELYMEHMFFPEQ